MMRPVPEGRLSRPATLARRDDVHDGPLPTGACDATNEPNDETEPEGRAARVPALRRSGGRRARMQTSPSAPASTHATTARPEASAYEPASIVLPVGSDCWLRPPGETRPEKSLAVHADPDGVARFYAVRATQPDAVQSLSLDCTDLAGQARSYAVDLRSDETFAPRPFDPARAHLAVRPPLAGDPLTYAVGDLIRMGYGLRPDPVASPEAYADWLTAARTATYAQREPVAPRPLAARSGTPEHLVTGASPHANAGPTQQGSYCSGGGDGGPPGCYWTGVELSGSYLPAASPPRAYVADHGTFTIPPLTAGGLGTGNTTMSIWTGLDNVFQTIVFAGVTSGAAGYGTGVEVQLDQLNGVKNKTHDISPNTPSNANGAKGVTAPFSVGAGDRVLLQEWYCDSAGNPNLSGGFACTFAQDVSQPSYPVWNCSQAQSSTCSSTWSLQTAGTGTSAEYIVENDAPQNGNTYEWPDFIGHPITVTGAAALVVSGSGAGSSLSQTGGWVTLATDPGVAIDQDWAPTVLPDGTGHVVVSLSGSNVVWTEETGCGGLGQACCTSSYCASASTACSAGTCSTCGGVGQPCCITGSACSSGAEVCSGGTCQSCGATGELCCASSKCTTSGDVCQQGVCGIADVLTANPSSVSVRAGDGKEGGNTIRDEPRGDGLLGEQRKRRTLAVLRPDAHGRDRRGHQRHQPADRHLHGERRCGRGLVPDHDQGDPRHHDRERRRHAHRGGLPASELRVGRVGLRLVRRWLRRDLAVRQLRQRPDVHGGQLLPVRGAGLPLPDVLELRDVQLHQLPVRLRDPGRKELLQALPAPAALKRRADGVRDVPAGTRLSRDTLLSVADTPGRCAAGLISRTSLPARDVEQARAW